MSKILTNPKGTIKLELRDDRLSAWLTLQDRDNLIDEEEILALIDEAGIKTGFEEALRYIRKHGLEKEFNTPFPIAVCERVKGESKLNYYFDLEQAKSFSGVITPANLCNLACIEEGTVLADYSSNIFDRQGSIYDIYGEMLQVEDFDAQSARELVGRNVEYSESSHQYLALKAGFVQVDDQGRISILDELTIDGDVTAAEGVLRTPVGLRIKGDVVSARIVAAGDLSIEGKLSDSSIYCEGNLLVKGQILDCRQPGLEVMGDLRCESIELSRILCRGTLEFTGQVLDSEIVADRGIRSEDGAISGGHTESCGDVRLARLGARDGRTTELEITISPFYKALLLHLTKELLHLKQDPHGNEEQIAAVENKITACETELDNDLNLFLQRPQTERINLVISQEVYPPVMIRILKHEYQISSPQRGLQIQEKD